MTQTVKAEQTTAFHGDGATHALGGRPVMVTKRYRARHFPRRFGYYDVVQFRFLDGNEPTSGELTAARFARAAIRMVEKED